MTRIELARQISVAAHGSKRTHLALQTLGTLVQELSRSSREPEVIDSAMHDQYVVTLVKGDAALLAKWEEIAQNDELLGHLLMSRRRYRGASERTQKSGKAVELAVRMS